MGSVFDPESGRYVRATGPPARRSNPAIPGRPEVPARSAAPARADVPAPPDVPAPRAPREQQPAPEPRPARRRFPWGRLVLAALLGALVVGLLSVSGLIPVGGGGAPRGPVDAAPLPVYGAGVHRVGDTAAEMSAGRYVTAGPDEAGPEEAGRDEAGPDEARRDEAGPDDGAVCRVVRLSAFGGGAEDVVAERDVEGPTTLRVIRADAGVILEGPCTWRMG